MCAGMPSELPAELFLRADESNDADFYSLPRLVTHIDDATIDSLTEFYRQVLSDGADVLDLMSSWVSHLPPDRTLGRVAGLGMNTAELETNPRLTEFCVHDLNVEPKLPYADASFDAVLNAVSVQYLTRPLEVYAEVARVLRPGGISVVAMSHRCFPTKAIAAFRAMDPAQRVQLVGAYHTAAGDFESPDFEDRSPGGADPLWILRARRSA